MLLDSDALVATPNFIGQHYLHKDADDEATGLIGFIKGLWIKAAGLFGFSEDGDVVARTLTAKGSSGGTVADIDNATRKNLGLEVAESGIIGGILRVAKSILTKTIQSLNFTGGDSMFGTGWQLTDNDGNGNSRLIVDNLFVRGRAVFNELEVRKFVAMGGNYVFSPAASIIEEVDYIVQNRGIETGEIIGEEVLGYTYIKVPWVLRLVPLSLVGKILSKKKFVRTTISASDLSQVNVFRCWLRSDDGTTRTINTWQVGMLARCQTFNMASGREAGHTGTWNDEEGGKSITNKLYWRAVTGIGEAKTKDNYDLENHILEDGLTHNYIDLSNDEGMFLAGSDKPEALDNIVCFGDWKDRTLSNLITIETVGSEAPCIREMLDVGYTDGGSIDWSLNNKERTRISPVAGNKFVAPEFYIGAIGLKQSIETAGLHIDGNRSKFVAKANTFEVQNSSGVITFSIDADGNLQSSGNAAFKGKVTATSGRIGNVTIDENGNLVTSGNAEFSGKINASSGQVGGFNITSINNVPTLLAQEQGGASLALNNGGIIFSNWDVRNAYVNGKFDVGVDDNIVAAIGVKKEGGSRLNTIAALQLGASGNADVCSALDITDGFVTGLRLYVKTITAGSSYTPTPKEGIIVINASNDFNLVLPSPGGEYVGKFYLIRNKNTSYALTVSCANGSGIVFGNNGTLNQVDTITRPTTLCFSDGSNWIMMYSDY